MVDIVEILASLWSLIIEGLAIARENPEFGEKWDGFAKELADVGVDIPNADEIGLSPKPNVPSANVKSSTSSRPASVKGAGISPNRAIIDNGDGSLSLNEG